MEHKEVQKIAKDTIEYIKTVIRPGMSLPDIRRMCEEKCYPWARIPFGIII